MTKNKLRLNILVFVPFFPKADISAGDRRLTDVLTLLALDYEVDLCCPMSRDDHQTNKRYIAELKSQRVNVLPYAWRPLSSALTKKLYDCVIFELWFAAQPNIKTVREHQPWAKIIIDTVDINYVREEAGVAHGFLDSAIVAQQKANELETYRKSDALIIVTDSDMKSLETEQNLPPQYLVPMVAIPVSAETKPREPIILFIGWFLHKPNIDGIMWFIREIWPSVKLRSPLARLQVIGRDAPKEVLELGSVDGVELLGYIPDVAPYLNEASVSIAPLRFGAGMKGKVTEALASGRPVVTTSVGIQGLNIKSGRELLAADTPGEFADNVTNLLQNPGAAEAMGERGRQYILTVCGQDVVKNQLTYLLSTVVQNERHKRPSKQYYKLNLKYYCLSLLHSLCELTGILDIREKRRLASIGRGTKAVLDEY